MLWKLHHLGDQTLDVLFRDKSVAAHMHQLVVIFLAVKRVPLVEDDSGRADIVGAHDAGIHCGKVDHAHHVLDAADRIEHRRALHAASVAPSHRWTKKDEPDRIERSHQVREFRCK